VTCLIRTASQADRLRELGAEPVCGDVTDPVSLSGPLAGAQVVYHLAGRNAAFRAEEFYRVNEQGVRNVVRACAEQAAPPVVVLLSSLAAAGPACGGRFRTEDDPPVQFANYGRSKRAGELAAEEYAGRVPITVIRASMAFGPADRQTLPMFKSVARFGVHVIPGLGRARFSLIHVADLVDLLILAARRGRRLRPAGQRVSSEGYYFAACGEDPTYAQLGRMIAAALGRRHLLMVPTLPQWIWIVGLGAEALSRLYRHPFSINFDKAREVRAGSWVCSPQRAIDQLGFSPAAPLADRLRETAEWYRQRGWL
jgi:dihydroflavonol-4-reductase